MHTHTEADDGAHTGMDTGTRTVTVIHNHTHTGTATATATATGTDKAMNRRMAISSAISVISLR